MFARVLLLFELLLKEMLFLFHFVAGSTSAFRVRSIENNERLSNLKSPSFNCLPTNFEQNYFEQVQFKSLMGNKYKAIVSPDVL